MFKCYNLLQGKKVVKEFLQNTYNINSDKYFSETANIQERILENVNKLTNGENYLDGDVIQAEWFPTINAKVFISHSHEDLATALFLKKKFDEVNVPAFVDSVVWGYCDDLLKKIDNKYCRNSGSHTYNYKKRNNTTAAVHMMLSNALTQMMDKCECVLFLNTHNSNLKDCCGRTVATASPWIFHEISMMKVLRQQTPRRLLNEQKRTRTIDSISQTTQFIHNIPIWELPKIDASELISWLSNEKSLGVYGDDLLKNLYCTF